MNVTAKVTGKCHPEDACGEIAVLVGIDQVSFDVHVVFHAIGGLWWTTEHGYEGAEVYLEGKRRLEFDDLEEFVSEAVCDGLRSDPFKHDNSKIEQRVVKALLSMGDEWLNTQVQTK